MQFITKLRINYLKRRLEYLVLKVPVHKINRTKIDYISKKLKGLGYVPEDSGYTIEQFELYYKLGIFKIKESIEEDKVRFVKLKTDK